MSTCHDCELFVLAKGCTARDGERTAYCPRCNKSVRASDAACGAYRSIYEGVFSPLPGKH